MRPLPRSAGSIPQLRPSGAARSLDPPTGRCDPTNRLGQQTRVGGISDVRRHHRSVDPDPGAAQQFRLRRLGQQRLVQPFHRQRTQRVVSFINVVGCGTGCSKLIRQNRRHAIESETSRENDSNPNR
jgi:hypothetical protein